MIKFKIRQSRVKKDKQAIFIQMFGWFISPNKIKGSEGLQINQRLTMSLKWQRSYDWRPTNWDIKATPSRQVAVWSWKKVFNISVRRNRYDGQTCKLLPQNKICPFLDARQNFDGTYYVIQMSGVRPSFCPSVCLSVCPSVFPA